jgi:hypothetical protein
MKQALVPFVSAAMLAILAASSQGQKAPDVGYIFPPGGKAGTTVEVRIGGYDWTPDMEFFVLDNRIQLIPTGPPGPILIPPPPYWFGAKGRIVASPLPREMPARLVLPPNFPPGPVHWQAANANGGTSMGVFIVSNGPEVVEELPGLNVAKEGDRGGAGTAQLLTSLPMTVSGRLMKIEEVDRYRFVAPPKDGPITCDLMARRLGAKFLGVLEVRDRDGRVVADAAGTNGMDPSLTFAAKANAEYVVNIHDVDFGGDRSYVYRLTVTPGPRVVGALPAAGKRGETREVEFVGIGLATGAMKLESVKRQVTFPADAAARSFDYRLETPLGSAPPFMLLLSDLPESVEFPRQYKKADKLQLPAGVTGVLDQADAVDHYLCDWKKGEVWSLSLEARRIGSPLDVALALFGPDGKELARNDDLPETTDAGLEFVVPADGPYRIAVSDSAGKSGSRSAIYHLTVRPVANDFALQLALQRVSVPIGGKFDLAVKAVRKGDCKGPINLTVKGLPAGVSVAPNLVIPADKVDFVISLQAAKDAVPNAALVSVEGSTIAVPSGSPGSKLPNTGAITITRPALARTAVNHSARSPEENQVPSILVAAALKPLFKGRPVDQDTGRKVHRGTTFPADVIIERLDGFQGEIVLQMAAQQSYQVQGISGGDVVVPPGSERAIYPCFMPEWLETSRTSRMGMIAVAKVPDARGKARYMVNEITGFVTMTMEGALLKVSSEDHDLFATAGQPFEVRIKVSRLAKLSEPVQLELRPPDELAGRLKAEAVTVPVGKESAVVRITPAADLRGVHTFTIRGTALQDGKYPAISEASVTVELRPVGQAPR